MSVDLRAFDYALEPIRAQRRWQLDALHAQLGSIQRQIDTSRQALAGLRESRERQSRQVAEAMSERFDAGHHAQALQWLARAQAHILAAEQSLQVLREERAMLQEHCLKQQREVDVIEAHRTDALAEFARAEAQRQASEADRDWLSRRATAPRTSSSSPAGMP